MIEGDWSGRVTGLRDQRVEIAMMRTPDGYSRPSLAISRAACRRRSPERPGERAGLFACHVRGGRPRRYAARLRKHGAQLVDEVVRHENVSALTSGA